MPESWRDEMREYKDRWIIGLAVALSVLAHVGLFLLFWTGAVNLASPMRPAETIDFDLARLDQKTLEEMQARPDRLLYNQLAATEKAPEKPEAYGFQNRDAGKPSHLADKPINEIQRDMGPRGPGQGLSAPGGGSPGRSRSLPPIPEVGEGVGDRADRQPTKLSKYDPKADNLNRSVDQMLSRTGSAGRSGGGEDGIDPFNPNVGDAGKVLSISTREYKYMGYFSHMREKIYLVWVYPQEAANRGQQGVVALQFTIERSGAVSKAEVVRSSGYRLLDQYAIKAVREANFNPMPESWPDKNLTILASFIYNLVGSRAIQ
jgi:protein TonB